MLSYFTISAVRFATFCLFVVAAVLIYKKREEEIRQSIMNELLQAKHLGEHQGEHLGEL